MLLEIGSCQSFGWHQPDASGTSKGPANPAPGFCRKGDFGADLRPLWQIWASIPGSRRETGNPLPFPVDPWISHRQGRFLLGGFGRPVQVSYPSCVLQRSLLTCTPMPPRTGDPQQRVLGTEHPTLSQQHSPGTTLTTAV